MQDLWITWVRTNSWSAVSHIVQSRPKENNVTTSDKYTSKLLRNVNVNYRGGKNANCTRLKFRARA